MGEMVDEGYELSGNDVSSPSPINTAKRQRTSSDCTDSISSMSTMRFHAQKSKNVKVYNANSKRAGTAGVMKELVEVLKEGNAQQQKSDEARQMLDMLRLQFEMREKDRERERSTMMAQINHLRAMLAGRQASSSSISDSAWLDDFIGDMPTQDFKDT